MENYNMECSEIFKIIVITGLIGYTILFSHAVYLILKFFRKNKMFK